MAWSIVLLTLFLVGCATYQPEPLPVNNDLALQVDQPRRPEGMHSAIANDGLGLTDIAVLAVRNNPELNVRRKQLG